MLAVAPEGRAGDGQAPGPRDLALWLGQLKAMLDTPSEDEGRNPMATILMVEDDELNSDMLKRRLERLGHGVRVARDGLEGLAMAAEPALSLAAGCDDYATKPGDFAALRDQIDRLLASGR